jgi:ParB/RepB/Spo0J family partition protein
MKLPLNKVKTAKDFNPREALDRAQVDALALSMKTLGQLQAIEVREGDNELIDGKHRWAAAKKLRWKEIEVKTTRATDLEARIRALASNNFSKRLNHLELGKAVHFILKDTKKRKGRGMVKQQLAKQLGLSVKALEDCLATYQDLNPEARELSSYAVGKQHILTVEHLRDIRQLPGEKQVAVLKQIVKASDASTADRLVSGFMAAQELSMPTGERPSKPEIEPTERAPDDSSNEISKPPLNEIVLATALRLFKEIEYSASGICPECRKQTTIKQAQVEFDPPLWVRDLEKILTTDLEKLSRNHEHSFSNARNGGREKI